MSSYRVTRLYVNHVDWKLPVIDNLMCFCSAGPRESRISCQTSQVSGSDRLLIKSMPRITNRGQADGAYLNRIMAQIGSSAAVSTERWAGSPNSHVLKWPHMIANSSGASADWHYYTRLNDDFRHVDELVLSNTAVKPSKSGPSFRWLAWASTDFNARLIWQGVDYPSTLQHIQLVRRTASKYVAALRILVPRASSTIIESYHQSKRLGLTGIIKGLNGPRNDSAGLPLALHCTASETA